MSTDMDIFMDMMSGQETPFVEVIESAQPNSYYQGLGIHLLKQMDTNEHYFHFLQSILSNFNQLEEGQKKILQEKMGFKPEVIIKEKIVYKEKKNQKKGNKKPILNTRDDY